MASYEGWILEQNLSWLEEKITKLNKRAKKLGLKEIVVEISEEVKILENEETGNITALKHVKLTGDSPVIAGWKLIAVINHMDGENILRVVPGETLPEKYRNRSQMCDHCGHNRFRKDTFVVQHENGNSKQVGSACVADFLGHGNPKAFMEAAKYPFEFESLFGEGEKMQVGYVPEYTLLNWLANTVAVINEYGWTSSGKAHETYENPTWNYVADQFNPHNKDKVAVTETDVELAKKVIEYLNSFEPKSDYEHNLKVLAKLNYVNYKTYAIAASAVPTVKRIWEKTEIRKATKPSEYVGKIGERKDFNLKLVNTFEFDGIYGVTYIHKFLDNCGNVFIWKTNSFINHGSELKLKGTIKDHNEYREVKQTVLTRCKIS